MAGSSRDMRYVSESPTLDDDQNDVTPRQREQADRQTSRNFSTSENDQSFGQRAPPPPARPLPVFQPRSLPDRPHQPLRPQRSLPATPEEFNVDEDGYECPSDLLSDCYEEIPFVQPEEWKSYSDPNRCMLEEPRFEIDLLLIGKTGQGKSALGNSLLRRNTFLSKPSTTSVTKTVSDDFVDYKGYVIKVVDGPGVVDTDMNTNEERAKDLMLESLSNAISINLRGYHAFLLVVKYGDRYTKESRLAIEVLKNGFGKNFVKNFCILVMTFGDLFEGDGSFRDWLREQEGGMPELVKECGNRVILFNNKAKRIEERETQMDALLRMVMMLALKNGRYTSEQFNLAKLSRNALAIEPKKLFIEEESMKEASLIIGNLQQLQIDTENIDDPNKYETLNQLKSRASLLLENLKAQDQNTGVLQDLISHVQSLHCSIDDEIRLVQRISQLLSRVSSQCKRSLSERIRRQKKEFYLNHVEGKTLEDTVDKTLAQLDPTLSGDGVEEIYSMKKQWKKTNELNSELKEMKTRKKQSILGTLQRKVLMVLRGNMKTDRKSVGKTDILRNTEK